MTATTTGRACARSLTVAATTAVLALSACSSGGSADEPAAETSAPATTDSSSSAEASAEPSEPTDKPSLAVPDGVELTPEGSLLSLGEAATVAYEPDVDAASGDDVDVVDLEVDRLVRTTFERSFDGWQLDNDLRTSTPYFVTATLTNAGERPLRDRTVPLFLLDDQGTLVEPSTFAGDFEPCPSTPLPKRLRPGAEREVCLVYLAPEGRELAGVSFRPDQQFEAITWTGQVRTSRRG